MLVSLVFLIVSCLVCLMSLVMICFLFWIILMFGGYSRWFSGRLLWVVIVLVCFFLVCCCLWLLFLFRSVVLLRLIRFCVFFMDWSGLSCWVLLWFCMFMVLCLRIVSVFIGCCRLMVGLEI